MTFPSKGGDFPHPGPCSVPWRIMAQEPTTIPPPAAAAASSTSSSSPTDTVVFFGISLVLGIACRHLLRGTRVPYTVALLIIGIALGSLDYATDHGLGMVGNGIQLYGSRQFKNPDEFNFGMINSQIVDGVHRRKAEPNKYTHEELMLMKTQDAGYVLLKLQTEKKKIEKLSSGLHSLDGRPPNKHIYFAKDREEAKEIRSRSSEKASGSGGSVSIELPDRVKRKMESSYRQLEARKNRANQLENVYMEMTMQLELQKKGRKRKLKEDELVTPTSNPVYKWRAERKR